MHLPKRMICIFLSLFAVMSALSGCGSEAKTVSDSGFYAIVYKDHCEINGMSAESEQVNVPQKIKGKPVTAIAEGTFSGLPVVSVTLPDTVTSIGKAAFANCNNLVEIKLPGSLNALPDSFSDA